MFKLQQTGTVSEYLTEFERLANRTMGLPPSCLLSCFVSGLIPELRREVQALRPLSLPHATELARLQEDKLLDRRRGQRSSSTTLPPKTGHPQPSNSTKVPIKRLTSEELAVRREQGLCYHCEEKWSHGHRCRPRLHLFIADDDLEPPEDFNTGDTPNPITADLEITPQISLNTMEGTPAPQTFRLLGQLRRHQVIILIDGGSTHNFIQSRLARFLALSTVPTATLRVMVGNGNTLECNTQSLQVPISIQDHTFTLDLFHLPLCGADLVLGVQWLKQLGPITTDYQRLTMTFSHLGRNITLHADAPPSLSPASAHQLKRLAQTQSISALYHISALPIDTPSSTCTAKLPVPEPLPPQIVSILERFPAIFAEPSTLPPSRNIQHHIHLLPHTAPINVRPYRYPHF